MIVTFYSFKGGVGRTLALANVAHHMAQAGLRVLVIDFDLEAPGLSILDDFTGLDASAPRRGPGVVDIILAYQQEGKLPPLDPFVLAKCGVEQRIAFIPVGDVRDGGQYGRQLSKVDWSSLTAPAGRGPFAEGLRGRLAELRAAGGEWPFDYVLVDSRTGITGISHLCAVEIPDLLVVVSGLNRQSIWGTGQFLQAVRSASAGKALPHLVVVASPVVEGDPTVMQERTRALVGAVSGSGWKARSSRRQWLELFSPAADEPIPLAHNASLAVREQVAFGPGRASALVQGYEKLAGAIRSWNEEDPGTLLRSVRLAEKFDPNLVQGMRVAIRRWPNYRGLAGHLAKHFLRSSGEAEVLGVLEGVSEPNDLAVELDIAIDTEFDPEPLREDERWLRIADRLLGIEESRGDPDLLGARFLLKAGRLGDADKLVRRAVGGRFSLFKWVVEVIGQSLLAPDDAKLRKRVLAEVKQAKRPWIQLDAPDDT